MAVCEDAPCCGCCGTSVYGPADGYGRYDEREYDDDPYYDEDADEDDGDWCLACGDDLCDCECDTPEPASESPVLDYVREDLGWDGGREA